MDVGTGVLRLAFCDRPPYAVLDGDEHRGAWLTVVTAIVEARNLTASYVQGDTTACESDPRATLIATLQSGAADIALYPFIFNQTYPGAEGLVSAFPIESGSPIFVTERRVATFSVFTDPFDSDSWGLLLIMLALSILVAALIDRHGSRTRHIPRVFLAMFGTVDLPEDSGPAHWIVYTWIALLSIIVLALYTSIMAQVLLLNTVALDTFAKADAEDVTVSVTYDIQEQLQLSNSPFTLALNSNHRIIPERDALDNLPVLVSWPVSSMMRQQSCDDLDLAYRELSKVPYSTLARPEVPSWFYDDIRDAVFKRQIPKAVQAFVLDHPFCSDKSTWNQADTQIVMPVVYIALGALATSWALHLCGGLYSKFVEPRRRALVTNVSGRASLLLTSARSSFRCGRT